MKPRKSKTVNEETQISKMIDADFEHDYFEERLESIPPITEGTGEDYS